MSEFTHEEVVDFWVKNYDDSNRIEMLLNLSADMIASTFHALNSCYSAAEYDELVRENEKLIENAAESEKKLVEAIKSFKDTLNEKYEQFKTSESLEADLQDAKTDLKILKSELNEVEQRLEKYKAKCEAYESVIGMIKDIKK